jgi:hypothetical protein
MSQFSTSISSLRKQLISRFDAILCLRNADPETLDRDAHYAVYRLAADVAHEFPSADVEVRWSRETISYYLPPTWDTNTDPHWLVDCPRLVVDYNEALDNAPDATLCAGSSGSYLQFSREFRVDNTVARVYICAYLPTSDEMLLRAIGKIADIEEPAYTRTTSLC